MLKALALWVWAPSILRLRGYGAKSFGHWRLEIVGGLHLGIWVWGL